MARGYFSSPGSLGPAVNFSLFGYGPDTALPSCSACCLTPAQLTLTLTSPLALLLWPPSLWCCELFFFLFFKFWLCWVFTAMCGLSGCGMQVQLPRLVRSCSQPGIEPTFPALVCARFSTTGSSESSWELSLGSAWEGYQGEGNGT